jgi:hypothetical protein
LELIGNSISVEIGESSGGGGDGSDSKISHGQYILVDVWGLDDLLIDGESLLDEDWSIDLLVDDWLDFLDDLVDNGLVDNGSILDNGRSSSQDLFGGEISGSRSSSKECGVILDNDCSSLSGKHGRSNFGCDNFSLSHGLDDFVDIELFSLSFNDGLDLDDFLSLVHFMDNGGFLDLLDDDGSFSDIDDR